MKKTLSNIITTYIVITFFLLTNITNSSIESQVLVYNLDAPAIDPQLNAMIQDMNWLKWTTINSSLEENNLEDITHLILYNHRHDRTYTQTELDAIKNWYNVGGKTIWVSSDSDFFTNNGRITSANQILTEIDSSLRAESASVRDPVHNAYPNFRLLAVPETNEDTIDIVEGVERVLVSGPSSIIGYVNEEFVALEESNIENILVVLVSQETSELVDNTGVPPEAHSVGTGSFVVLAVEIDPVRKNIVIVGGESVFASGEGMYKPELLYPSKYTEDYPQQGSLLVENLLRYSIEKEWPEETGINIPLNLYTILLGIGVFFAVLQREK